MAAQLAPQIKICQKAPIISSPNIGLKFLKLYIHKVLAKLHIRKKFQKIQVKFQLIGSYPNSKLSPEGTMTLQGLNKKYNDLESEIREKYQLSTTPNPQPVVFPISKLGLGVELGMCVFVIFKVGANVVVTHVQKQ